jgi:hypothetical protein
MKNTLLTSLLAMSLFISPVSIFATGPNGQSETMGAGAQEQRQQREQLLISEPVHQQARARTGNQFRINEQARQQQQDRLQQEEQSQSCFSDTVKHWAKTQIKTAYAWGLVNGYPDKSFNPNGEISGIEGVFMMSRMMDCVDGEESDAGTTDDIDLSKIPEWAKERIQEASMLRIATQSHFYGESTLNRLQFAIMLSKAIELESIEVLDGTLTFLDQDAIPTENLGSIHALRVLGIINGNNGNFYPDQIVTRAEAATMLSRVFDIIE